MAIIHPGNENKILILTFYAQTLLRRLDSSAFEQLKYSSINETVSNETWQETTISS